MSNIYSRRGTTLASYHIDPLKASNYAHERYNLQDLGHCVDPLTHTFDQYHRQAHPNSLTINGQGGSCSALHPNHNLQSWLYRENAVDRPYIDHDLQNYGYDTLGKGRDHQSGGWYRVNMSDDRCCEAPHPYHDHSDSAHGNESLGATHSYQYSG